MNLSNENGDLILKVLGGIIAFFSLRWVLRIFAGEDRKLSLQEFIKFAAFCFFIWAAVYIIMKEANRPRPESADHIFSELWIFFTMSGLISVLSLDKAIDAFTRMIEAIVRLRTTTQFKNEEANTTTNINVNSGDTGGGHSNATTGP